MTRARMPIAAIVLSAAGFVGILGYEGYRDTAYIPVPGDVPTIGFGTTNGVKMGDSIKPPQAVARALQDAGKYEGALKSCVRVPLHQYEYDAYTSLAYNIGPAAFCGSTLVKKLNAEDYAGACAEISRWDKGPRGPLPGLTNRRAKERALCEGENQ
jgi:lysozyme